jgi:hypothetical protein
MWWLTLDNDPKKGLFIQASDWTTKDFGGLHLPHVDPFGSFVIPYWVHYCYQLLVSFITLPVKSLLCEYHKGNQVSTKSCTNYFNR